MITNQSTLSSNHSIKDQSLAEQFSNLSAQCFTQCSHSGEVDPITKSWGNGLCRESTCLNVGQPLLVL